VDPTTTFAFGATQKTAQGVFNSIFESLASRARAWHDLRALIKDSAARYAELIERRVGWFPLFATTKSAPVSEAYVSVCISDRLGREVYRSDSDLIAELLLQREGTPIRQPLSAAKPLDAVENTSAGLALLGTPGSGKTTIFRHIAMYLASGGRLRGQMRIPFFVAVREMRQSDITVIASVESFLSFIDVKEPRRVLQSLLDSGQVAILVDGLDETDEKHQEMLLNEVEDLASRYPKLVICISARPHSLSKDLVNFTKWETLPFNSEDRVHFAENWFRCVDATRVESFLLACKTTPGMLDLGSNPLLLSIVCAVYYNELDVPSEPTELFSRAVEGMLGGWDNFRAISRKGPLSDLSIPKRVTLVATIAAELLSKRRIIFRPVELDGFDALRELEERFSRPLPEPGPLLAALANDFGIITERSPGTFSFSHLSLQEYLVARYVVDHRRERELLNSHGKDAPWYEVIAFVAKMLPQPDDFLRSLIQINKLPIPQYLALLAKIMSLKPSCTYQTKNLILSQCAGFLSNASRLFEREFEREGDLIWCKTSAERFVSLKAQVDHIQSASRSAKLTQFRSTDDEEKSVKKAAKISGKAGARLVDQRTIGFAVLACLTELNQILHHIVPDPNDKRLPPRTLIAALAGPLAEGPIRLELRIE
jgi:hypothetical protein